VQRLLHRQTAKGVVQRVKGVGQFEGAI